MESEPSLGDFFRDQMEVSDSTYDLIRQKGSSWFSRGINMPIDELKSLIESCRGQQASYINEKIEAKITPLAEACIDGTYMNGPLFLFIN